MKLHNKFDYATAQNNSTQHITKSKEIVISLKHNIIIKMHKANKFELLYNLILLNARHFWLHFESWETKN